MEKVVVTPGGKTRLPDSLRRRWVALVRRQELMVFLLLLLVGTVLSIQTETFLTERNLLNIARNFSWIAIAAFGQCLVIIIRGIDLSAGSAMALAGLAGALCLQAGLPTPVAIIAGLLIGSLIGFVNGMLVGRVGLPPLIVTLGTLFIARGLTLSLTEGRPVQNLPPEFRNLGQYELPFGPWSLPLPLIAMLILALLVGLLLNRTVLGRYIYTLGSNERALVIAGVSTARLKVLVYTLAGLLTAVSGLIMTARVGVAAPTAAIGYELNIIAAVIIGGASLYGGEGGIVGVLLGTMLMQVVSTGLFLLGVPGQWQTVAIGAMIVLVALIDYWRRRRVVV